MTRFLATLKYSEIGTDDTNIICAQSMIGVLQEKHGGIDHIRAYAAEEGYPEPDTFPRLLWWVRLVHKEATEAFLKESNVDLIDYINDLKSIDRCLGKLGIAPNPN